MAPDLNIDWKQQRIVKKDGQWTVDGRPTNDHQISWHESPPNMPGQAFVGLMVTVPVNAATPPHRHGDAALTATVIEGKVINQMICADGHVVGPKVYEKGESWYEAPGCHHVISQNAGTERASFIVSIIVSEQSIKEKGLLGALVQLDAEVEGAKSDA